MQFITLTHGFFSRTEKVRIRVDLIMAYKPFLVENKVSGTAIDLQGLPQIVVDELPTDLDEILMNMLEIEVV